MPNRPSAIDRRVGWAWFIAIALAMGTWPSPIIAGEKDHWAFLPLADHPLPEVRGGDLVQSPIDRFLQARLEQKGLEPAPPADKRTLLRRVTYDLIGLPPAAEDVEAFLADESPDALPKVVDRLLASPHYGERWGRYWLDLSRYADTKGYIYEGREDRRFFHAHVYRDWVIRALNADLPYDQFLLQQIAGDRLATTEDCSPLAAMGFVTIGRRFAGNFYEIIDDRIDTLCRTTMALTVSCARCHDHKFDPISSGDYYSLYGIFAGSYDAVSVLKEPPETTPEQTAFAEELRKRQAAYDNLLKSKTDEVLARVRARTADYLKAVLNVESLPTEHEYRFLSAEDLNPVFVRQWHAQLIRHQSGFDPLLEPWRAVVSVPDEQFAGRFAEWFAAHQKQLNPRVAEALAGNLPQTKVELAERLGSACEQVNQNWLKAAEAAKAAGTEPPSALPDEADEAVRKLLYGSYSPISVPHGHCDELEWCFDESTRVELGKLQHQLEQWLVDAPAAAPQHVVYLTDRAQQPEPRIFENGNPAIKGDAIPRGILGLLARCNGGPVERGSGRYELAQAIIHRQNPLTPRVLVNRVWLHHFGSALVSTPSDFGLRSEPPTHPELLDWLAQRLIADGWSLKSLHRLIVLSYAYGQSSQASEAAQRLDPDNRLLSRMNRRRLDYEALHDSLLAVAGSLESAIGGRPDTRDHASPHRRRAVYAFVDRLNVPAVMRTFDVASPDAHSPERHETTIPQQALYLMNSPFLVQRVRGLMARPEIERARSPEERIDALYRLVFARAATEQEKELGARLAMADLAQPVVPPTAIWVYGTAAYDATQGQVADFAPLARFADAAWQQDDSRLTASGGHAASSSSRALVRRWISPIEGTVRVSGAIKHTSGEGDGIRAVIVSSRAGELAAFNVKQSSAQATLSSVRVQAGDRLDFVVLCRGDATHDDFEWTPLIHREGAVAAGERSEWSAATEFQGPPPVPLTPWEKYAQILLLTNEFAFVD